MDKNCNTRQRIQQGSERTEFASELTNNDNTGKSKNSDKQHGSKNS